MSFEEAQPEVVAAKSEDLDSTLGLDALVLGNPSRQEFLVESIREGRCYVAKIDGRMAGIAILEQKSFYGQGFISLVVVHPDCRRRGVASSLVRYVESICLTEKLFTSTNRSNVIMQQVLEKLGFVRSGYIENLDEGDPEIVYFKNLGEIP